MEAKTVNPAASALGKLSAKKRYAGMTKAQRVESMKLLRAMAKKKKVVKK